MRVYHGSYVKIDKINLSKCRPYKDFGKGFYVTKIRSQAGYWAERRGEIRQTAGFVTEFEFVESAFEHWEFRVLRFSGYTEEWLDFVVMNRDRKLPLPTHDYDLVEGPVADDDITSRIEDYLGGGISKADFLKELTYRLPTHQICLCSHRSLQAIEPVDKKYIKSMDSSFVEALINDFGLTEDKAVDVYYTSKTYARLTDKSTGLHEKLWTEVYEMLKGELDNWNKSKV
ncbi:hypothetical protein Barb6XT_00569 [Bacteroidales bacterium Barb6XT]|nr:hypothetical protein Barb6XT_00569 [Bacteroidales bacterium Barb6XT]